MSKTMKDDYENKELESLYQRRKKRYESPDDLNKAIYQKLTSHTASKKPWWKIELKQYFQVSALAFSCAVAFIVVNSQLANYQNSVAPTLDEGLLAYNNVTYHVIDEAQPEVFNNIIVASRSNTLKNPSPQLNKEEFAADAELMASEEELVNPEEVSEKEMFDAIARQKASRTQETKLRKVKYQQASTNYIAKQNGVDIHHQTYATVIQSDSGLDLLTCEKELLKISQEVVDLFFNPQQTQALTLNEGVLVSLSFDKKGHIIKLVEEKEKTQC